MSKPIRCVFRGGKAKVRARRRKANARERARMRHLNEMFDRLRELMPILGQLGSAERADALRKISKIDTLHLARNYIALLTTILEGGSLSAERLLAIIGERVSAATRRMLRKGLCIFGERIQH